MTRPFDVGDSESWPFFGEDEIVAATAVLRSGRVNSWTGTETERFEEEFATECGRRFGIAVANGTLALELALHAIDLQPDDEVIVPARSFFATAGCVVRAGGVPVFADIDQNTQNLDATTVHPCWSERTRALICVHLAGHPCDMDPLIEQCRERGVALIEDCAQAHGARYRGRPIGGLGDIGCFSFCQDKIITTGGEGGMVLLDSEAQWRRAWAFKEHGKSYDAVFVDQHPSGFRWYHESIGSNFRITEMQSAIGRLQLRKLDDWVSKRRRNAAILHEKLGDHDLIRMPFEAAWAHNAFYRLYGFVRPERFREGWTRDRLTSELRSQGIPSISGSCPEIYREKAFLTDGGAMERLPVAKELGETSFHLQVHPTLRVETMEHRAEVIRALFDQALA